MVSIYTKEKFSWWGLSAIIICEYKDDYLEYR